MKRNSKTKFIFNITIVVSLFLSLMVPITIKAASKNINVYYLDSGRKPTYTYTYNYMNPLRMIVTGHDGIGNGQISTHMTN